MGNIEPVNALIKFLKKHKEFSKKTRAMIRMKTKYTAVYNAVEGIDLLLEWVDEDNLTKLIVALRDLNMLDEFRAKVSRMNSKLEGCAARRKKFGDVCDKIN